MRSQLAAQFMPFFRLIPRILTFRDKKYRILTFRDKKYRILTFCNKTELYLTVLLTLALSGSLWLALLLSLAPSCSLLLSQAPYCSPNLRTTSSLGSQGPCSARSGAAALQHFMLLCVSYSKKIPNKNWNKILQSYWAQSTQCVTNAIHKIQESDFDAVWHGFPSFIPFKGAISLLAFIDMISWSTQHWPSE